MDKPEVVSNHGDKQSTLSDTAILQAIKDGGIIIEPFTRENLSTSSYDVTLGSYYYRESTPNIPRDLQIGGVPRVVYNPYSKSMVKGVWGEAIKAETHAKYSKRHKPLVNVAPHEKIIWISPGETILAHTQEFIGGTQKITTMMKARSSMGRNFIEVCKCAGWGDVGYYNRWTMEITNNSRFYTIPLIVGRRIAQIVFFETQGVESSLYHSDGKYQASASVDELKEKWTPELMLPKMYLDREVKAVLDGKIKDMQEERGRMRKETMNVLGELNPSLAAELIASLEPIRTQEEEKQK